MAQDFGDPNAQSTFEADLQRARGYKPVTSEDLTKAYAQYDLATGGVHKSDTDTQLYDKAKTTVLAWWARQHQAGAPGGGGGTPPPGGDPYGAPYEPVTGGSGYQMPPTGFTDPATTNAKAREGGGQPTLPNTAMAPPKTDPATTAAKAREGGSPAPPKAAAVVVKPPTMNNTQVTAVMRTIKGLSPSLQASAVPAQYRVSQAALVSYLNMKAKEYQLAVAKAAAQKAAAARGKTVGGFQK